MKAIIVLIICIPFIAFSQKYDQIWIGGIRSDKQFPKDCPWCTRVMTFTDTGIQYEYVKNYIEMRGTTPITISDKEGNLLFYTNGNTIASHDHSIMENGRRLNEGTLFSGYNIYGDSIGDWEYPSACFMVFPDPDDDNLFYVVHTYILLAGETDSIADGYFAYSGKLQITKIDMSANEGKGKVVYKNKILYSNVTGSYRFNATRHGNGRGWWVFLRNLDGNEYISIHLDKDSLVEVVYSPIPNVQPFPFDWLDSSFMAATASFVSPDGITLLDNCGRKGYVRVCNINRCTGIVSFKETLSFYKSIYDPADYGQPFNKVEEWSRMLGFSPNSQYLYVGGKDGYWQHDLLSSDIYNSGIKLTGPAIVMEDITQTPAYHLAENPFMALGPDGRLYALYRASHHVVNNPNAKGHESDFCLAYEQPPSCLGVPHHLFSPWYPNYRLGPLKSSDCDTIVSTITPEPTEQYGIRIVPNPASGPVWFDITLPDYAVTDTRVEVYDMYGRSVYSHTFPEYAYMHQVDTGSLPGGMYIVHLYQGTGIVATERFVVH